MNAKIGGIAPWFGGQTSAATIAAAEVNNRSVPIRDRRSMSMREAEEIDDVAEFVRTKLDECAKAKQSGIVVLDVTLSWGQPTGVNVTNRKNRKVRAKRHRFPT